MYENISSFFSFPKKIPCSSTFYFQHSYEIIIHFCKDREKVSKTQVILRITLTELGSKSTSSGLNRIWKDQYRRGPCIFLHLRPKRQLPRRVGEMGPQVTLMQLSYQLTPVPGHTENMLKLLPNIIQSFASSNETLYPEREIIVPLYACHRRQWIICLVQGLPFNSSTGNSNTASEE